MVADSDPVVSVPLGEEIHESQEDLKQARISTLTFCNACRSEDKPATLFRNPRNGGIMRE
jgi:hypothetical protein